MLMMEDVGDERKLEVHLLINMKISLGNCGGFEEP
jgi:hypothetical protein